MKVICLIIGVSIFLSCKNSSPVSAVKEKTPPTSNIETNTKEVNYDLTISFTSKGEGIDHQIEKKVKEQLIAFNKENKLNITPKIVNWGREGEKDYNFILKNLSTANKKAFISSMQEIIGSSDLTLIILDKKPVHKR